VIPISKTCHFVLEISDSTLEFVRLLARLTFPPPSHPYSHLAWALYSPFKRFFLRPSRHSQRCNVYLSPSLRNSRVTFHERREFPSVLVTAETPELLQRRWGLVSAGWRLHRHRGWFHGSKGGPGQTVVVHITRCPRPTDPYSRPVHRRCAAWHLTLKS